MTLPASGSLSISQIHAEFGHGQKLSDYVGKKWYKANGTEGTFSNPVKISDFYGTSKVELLRKGSTTLSSNSTNSFYLHEYLTALGWNGTSKVDWTFNVNAHQGAGRAAAIADSDPAGNAKIFPAGSIFKIVIASGKIVSGSGGDGGRGGGGLYGGNGYPGLPGGNAIVIRNIPTTITNNGTIQGGGGGGGGGAGNKDGNVTGRTYGGCGGGGAGYPGGESWDTLAPAGSNGTISAGGAGGTGQTSSGRTAGNGGKGGAPGAAGGTGGGYSGTGGSSSGSGGGSAGAAVVGNSRITWAKTGTRLGPIT